MEATREREAGRTDEPASGGKRSEPSLGALCAAYRSVGTELPVAVVVSVFDDVLTLVEPGGVDDVELDAIRIDPDGFAHPLVPLSLDAAGRLLTAALGEEQGSAPPVAHSLIARVTSEDPHERPTDPDQLRDWIRETLGSPAPRDEVISAAWSPGPRTVSAPVEPEPAERSEEPAGDFPDPDGVHDTVSLPTPSPDIADHSPDTADLDPSEAPSLEDPVQVRGEATADLEPADPPSARPVVRRELRRRVRPVSVASAPAARAPRITPGRRQGSIGLADESRGSGWLWALLIALAGGAVYYFFFFG